MGCSNNSENTSTTHLNSDGVDLKNFLITQGFECSETNCDLTLGNSFSKIDLITYEIIEKFVIITGENWYETEYIITYQFKTKSINIEFIVTSQGEIIATGNYINNKYNIEIIDNSVENINQNILEFNAEYEKTV